MTDFGTSLGFSLTKEYAVKKLQPPQPKSADKIDTADSENSDGLSSTQLSGDSVALLSTSTSSVVPQTPIKNKFLDLYGSAYSNMFSHNRLLAKVSEWMVGNVMEKLALLGTTPQELDGLKGQIRADLIVQNQTSMAQVTYDEIMLEIVA